MENQLTNSAIDAPCETFHINKYLLRAWRISCAVLVLLFGSLFIILVISGAKEWYLCFIMLPLIWVAFARGHFNNKPDLEFYKNDFRYYGFCKWYQMEYRDIEALAMYFGSIGERNRGYLLVAKTTNGKFKTILVPSTYALPSKVVETLGHYSNCDVQTCKTKKEFLAWKKNAHE